METLKVSIIIPVYNTEKYLERCFLSIQRQTYTNIEVIIVDDGSTDNSAQICKKFCENDSRFKYYYQNNSGVSMARNLGLGLAEGDLIAFVDSDDWIAPVMYEKIIVTMIREEADIAICDAYISEENQQNKLDTISTISKTCCLNKKNLSSDILCELTGAVWRCLYKSSVIKNKKVLFPEGLKLSEDRVFNIYSIGYSEKILYLKEPLYYRFVREGSAVYRRYEDMDEIVLYAYREIVMALKKTGFKAFQTIYDEQFMGTCYKAINDICYVDGHVKIVDKYKRIKIFCRTVEVQRVLKHTKHTYLKTILMKNKMYLLLTLVSIVTNFKKNKERNQLNEYA